MVSLRYFPESTRRHFASVLAVVLPDVIEGVYLYVGEFKGIWVNLSLPLRYGFLALVLAWPYSIDTISCMSNMGEILTLNGFSADSNPAMPLISFLLLGCFTFLGFNVIFSMSNSYWINYEIAPEVKILVMRFSAPNSVSLAFI